jgi:peptidoglycan DL-endopeptidase CwlO
LTHTRNSNNVTWVVTLLTFQLRRKVGKVATALTAAIALVGMAIPIAGADQLTNEQAEASSLAAKISTLGLREAALGEQYDAGVATLATANDRVGEAVRALAKAEAEQDKTINLLQQDAVEAYVGGGPQSAMGGSVPANNMDDALLREELAQTFAADQTDALDSYRLAEAEASTAKGELLTARDADARQVARLQKDRSAVEAAQAQLTSVQQQVVGKIAALVAAIQRAKILAEQRAEAALLARERAAAVAAAAKQAAIEAAEARAQAAQAAEEAAQQALAAKQAALRQAAEEAAAAATTTTTPPASITPVTTTPPVPQVPASSSAASAAVAAAESRVGDPYVWGAAGPGDFDCSGLVMWAYAQAGVYLPHFSGAQYDETVPIPMSDLEPGDLVFPADPGEHVAIYVGNGEIVQAPYTGADVQIVPLTSFFVLATRVG